MSSILVHTCAPRWLARTRGAQQLFLWAVSPTWTPRPQAEIILANLSPVSAARRRSGGTPPFTVAVPLLSLRRRSKSPITKESREISSEI
eukprot:1670806-Pleurochrysis_carterae.AAC.2